MLWCCGRLRGAACFPNIADKSRIDFTVSWVREWNEPSERRVDRYVQDVFICSQDMQRNLVFFCMYKPPWHLNPFNKLAANAGYSAVADLAIARTNARDRTSYPGVARRIARARGGLADLGRDIAQSFRLGIGQDNPDLFAIDHKVQFGLTLGVILDKRVFDPS